MSLRVAIVHDWLTGMRGGERVLESMLELFPNADIFTLVHVPGSVSAAIEARAIHTSFLQSAQERTSHWRRLLPLFPAALARFDLTSYDLVLSSSHCVAKAANGGRAVHVAYVHSPMRYLWDQYDAYFGGGRASRTERTAMRLVAPGLRRWDRATADRPDVLIANSAFIRDRIRRVWGRESSVIHPPVDVARFQPSPAREDFHLVVGALVPYKRVDIAVDAFRASGRRLMVVGDGPEYRRLRAAASPNIEFAGRLPDADVASLMGRCRTFLQPGEEDFGIAVVEAQAAGAPVVAYGVGGACETVVDSDRPHRSTGVLYRDASPAGLNAALDRAEATVFDAAVLTRHARRFSPERFRAAYAAAVNGALGNRDAA